MPEQFQDDSRTFPLSEWNILSRSCKPTDEVPFGSDVTASIRDGNGGHLEKILKSDDVTQDDDGNDEAFRT